MNDDDLYDPDGNIPISYNDLITDDVIDLTNVGAYMNVAPTYINNAQHITFYEHNVDETVHINEDGVRLSGSADITIEGKSLKQFMQAMEERLLILQEDFEKHEMYPALKDAYEKYKLIEKLMRNRNGS